MGGEAAPKASEAADVKCPETARAGPAYVQAEAEREACWPGKDASPPAPKAVGKGRLCASFGVLLIERGFLGRLKKGNSPKVRAADLSGELLPMPSCLS